MKTTLLTSILILFGCASNVFAQEPNTVSYDEITLWNTEVSKPGSKILTGNIAKVGNLLTIAAEEFIPVTPTQRTYVRSLNFADGSLALESNVDGINQHSQVPVDIASAGAGVRILLNAHVAPLGTNLTTHFTPRMHSMNPSINWFMGEYLFDNVMSDASPIDFTTSDNADFIIGNQLFDFEHSPCGGYSIFCMKSYTGSNNPVWLHKMNTSQAYNQYARTAEYATSIVVDQNANAAWISINSYDTDTMTESGRVARLELTNGNLVWAFNTGLLSTKKIVKQPGSLGDLVVFGQAQDDAGVHPVIAKLNENTIEWQKEILPTGYILDAIATSDAGYMVVGKNNDAGFIAKLDKLAEIEWVSYTPLPVHKVISVAENQYAFVLKDSISIWVSRSKELSGSVSVSEQHGDDPLRIGQEFGCIKIFGNFTQAKLLDISGKIIEEIISPATSVFSKVSASGVYIVDVTTTEQPHTVYRVPILN